MITLQMEETSSLKTSVTIHQLKYHIPEDP